MQKYMTLKEAMKVNVGFRLYKELAHASGLDTSTITEMAKNRLCDNCKNNYFD